MSRISFEGIEEVAATFACGEGVKAGQVVKLTGDRSEERRVGKEC